MTRRRGVGKAGIGRGAENTSLRWPSVRCTALRPDNLGKNCSNAHRALASGSRPQPRRQCPLDRVLLYVRREHGHKRAVRRIVSVRNDLLVDHAQRGEKDGPKRCDEPKSASFICSMNGSSSPQRPGASGRVDDGRRSNSGAGLERIRTDTVVKLNCLSPKRHPQQTPPTIPERLSCATRSFVRSSLLQ